jgi:HNH endonuclease
MLTTEKLKALFDLSANGGLVRKKTSTNSPAGQEVGFAGRNGYVYAMVEGKTYPLHRLVWMWHGNPDTKSLDHIDCDASNNRIENLRIASKSQNMQNRGIPSNNTSGTKGIHWHRGKKRWCVRIGVFGVRKYIGYFKDLELAELVAIEARNKYHGAYARHN